MNRLEGRSRDSFLEKGILKIIRARSIERDETEKREPHKITSPFVLESPQTHQDPRTANTSPATFLTCATKKKDGILGELMGIKSEKRKKRRPTSMDYMPLSKPNRSRQSKKSICPRNSERRNTHSTTG